MKNNQPYIGLTDIAKLSQITTLLKALPVESNRRLHVGIMTSYKHQRGLPTKWAGIWPTPTERAALFIDDPRVYNVVHYADYDELAPTTIGDLVAAIDDSGDNVDAIQLDMLWPSVNLVRQLKRQCPGIDIILQCSSKAMRADPDYINKLNEYQTFVDYVLIDHGMGLGIGMDVEAILKTLDALSPTYTDDRLAVAGGLGPATAHVLRDIFEKYPNISCDAQSKLRSSHNAMDPLQISYAKRYVQNVCKALTPST
jgi:phosphoribosylanthranilate isomerase